LEHNKNGPNIDLQLITGFDKRIKPSVNSAAMENWTILKK